MHLHSIELVSGKETIACIDLPVVPRVGEIINLDIVRPFTTWVVDRIVYSINRQIGTERLGVYVYCYVNAPDAGEEER